MNIQGTEIKIGRPKAYNGTLSALGLVGPAAGVTTTSTLLGMKGALTNMYHPLDDNTTQGIQNPLMGGMMAEEILQV
jgi:hypothetical protein